MYKHTTDVHVHIYKQVQFSDGSSAEGDLVVYDIFTFLFMNDLLVRIYIYAGAIFRWIQC